MTDRKHLINDRPDWFSTEEKEYLDGQHEMLEGILDRLMDVMARNQITEAVALSVANELVDWLNQPL